MVLISIEVKQVLCYEVSDLSVEKIEEDFPVTYAKTVSDTTVLPIGGSQRISKVHPTFSSLSRARRACLLKLSILIGTTMLRDQMRS